MAWKLFTGTNPADVFRLVDPAALREWSVDQGLSVAPWEGRANLFESTAGAEPGRGGVLMMGRDVAKLKPAEDYTLTVLDDGNRPVALKKLTITKTTCVTPSTSGVADRVYLVELADRRIHLSRIPWSKGYNLPASGTNYLTGTLNGGSAWTWATMINDIWAGLSIGAAPTLPYTPHASPVGFDFYGGWAWAALNHVCDRLGIVPDYDPVADTFELKKIGDDAAEKSKLASIQAEPRTWDSDPMDAERYKRPQKIRVLFRRVPAPFEGTDPFYASDVTLATAPGVVSGTFVQLRDDLVAVGATGTPTNSAALASRATDRAAAWLTKHEGRDRRYYKVWRDVRPEAAAVVGGTATAVRWEDRGGGIRTEVQSEPTKSMELWTPATIASGVGGCQRLPVKVECVSNAIVVTYKYVWVNFPVYDTYAAMIAAHPDASVTACPP